MKAVKSDNPRRKWVNENFLIRLDGYDGTPLEIHSAVGYDLAVFYGGNKFQKIIEKAKKGGKDKTKLQINHKLTLTLYNR